MGVMANEFSLTKADKLIVENALNLADGSALTVVEVKRYLPSRRLVCKGLWNHRSVYAKIFIGQDAKKYALRDKQGVQKLLDANIPTPSILYFGQTLDKSIYVLILEEIILAENLEVLWNRLPLKSSQRLQLAESLVRAVSQHHQHGLLQTDLYLKNFILEEGVESGVIYTLDGDGIQTMPIFNQQLACLKNLSVLLSKFDVLEIEVWLTQLLHVYAHARGWSKPPVLKTVTRLIHKHRIKVANDYANSKIFRSCTDVQVTESSRQFFAVVSEYADQDVIANMLTLDKSLHIPSFKTGNTCSVGLMQNDLKKNDALKIVIKRYNVKGIWHAITRCLRKTRAATSWTNAHRLKLLGLPAVKPISLLEARYFFGRLRGKSYFLSEYIEALDADVFFATEVDDVKRNEAIQHIVSLFYQLYLLNISHGDMKASNIKIVDDQPVLIDLDSMKQHTFYWFAVRRHARDLRRFMRNWQANDSLSSSFNAVFKAVYIDHLPLRLAKISTS